jgi:hypothetical protein
MPGVCFPDPGVNFLVAGFSGGGHMLYSGSGGTLFVVSHSLANLSYLHACMVCMPVAAPGSWNMQQLCLTTLSLE